MKKLFPLALASLVVFAASVGCDDERRSATPWADSQAREAPPGAKADDKAPSEESAPQASVTPEPPAIATARDLSPWMGVMGSPGAVPEKLALHFASDAVLDGTVLSFEPAVPGKLTRTSSSAFEFVPTGGFRPGVSYVATLVSVGVPGGVVQPAKDSKPAGAWALQFAAPAMALRDLTPVKLDTADGSFELRVAFTAAVEAGDVVRRAIVEVGESRAKITHARATPQAHIVRLIIEPPRGVLLQKGVDVRLRLRPGVPWARDGDVRAPGATRTVTFGETPTLTIHALRRREGPAGHFFEVICDDPAAKGRRDVWDPHDYEYYQVSSRCLPTAASAAEHITMDPKREVKVAASRGGFRILADVRRGPVTITLAPGLRTVDGAVLTKSERRSFVVPARRPSLRFASTGRYLPKRAWRRLPVRHMNTPELALQVRHIPRRNLSFWLSQGGEHIGDRVSDLVLDSKIPAKAPRDKETTTWIDVGGLIPDPAPGVYEIAVSGAHGARARARLLLTDISLIAKASRPAPGGDWADEIRVWALGIENGQGQYGVDVSLLTASGRTMATCRTDFQGGCTLTVPAKETDPSPPMAIVASSGQDFTYLKLSELRLDLSEHNVQGDPYRLVAPYRAGLYSDRGVYRPAETAHVVVMLRGRDDLAPPEGLPVELQVIDSRARVARRLMGETGPTGVVSFDVVFPTQAPTGRWVAKALVGKAEVGRIRLQVEEFVPERMKVEANAMQADLLAGEVLPVRIEAKYLFGASASGSPVEVTCRIEPHTFRLDADPALHFGPATGDAASNTPKPRPVDLGVVTGELDEQGSLVVTCPALERPDALRSTGLVVADVAVLEAGGGRASRAKARATVHPDSLYVGMAAQGSDVGAGKVRGVVVDWHGKPVAGVSAIDIEIAQLTAEHGWWWDEETGNERWERRLREASVRKERVKVEGGRFEVSAPVVGSAAGVLVRAVVGGARTELFLAGDAPQYSWYDPWGGGGRTPRPGRPAPLQMKTPDDVEVGKTSTVSFRSPYKGRALLTVETHKVLTAEWMDVRAGDNTWAFVLKEFAPNIYVSALIVKDPYLESAETFVPGRALGVASIPVRPKRFVETVRIIAPTEVRPNSVLPVEVRVGAEGSPDEPVVVTIAAVDEGILSLTRFKDPDPIKILFAQRALAVDTHETIGWALRATLAGTSAATGGDDEMEDAGPSRPMPIKPVALWSGLLVAKDGIAKAELQVPQYRGELRIMVVAIGRTRVGAASTKVTVKDPLVLQTTLPRYLAGDDVAQVPVFITNTTDRTRSVIVSVSIHDLPMPGFAPLPSVGPAAEVIGSDSRTLKLASGESGTAVFQVRALRQAGAVTFRVAARSGDLRSYDEADVPLLSAGPRVRRVRVVDLVQGDNDLAPHLTGWAPGSESTTLWATALDDPGAFGRLSYLMRYPYGCVEQTTSSARPLLYLSELLRATAPGAVARGGGVDTMVRSGIDRLLSMQTAEGGFSYWPGSGSPVVWGTAYATHFLMDARDRRHAVPERRLDEALDWLAQAMERFDGDYHGPTAEAYAHYVLALAKRPRKARIAQLLAEVESAKPVEGPAAESRYLLLAAQHLAGDRRRESELKDLPADALSGGRHTGHGYYSEGRRKALILSTSVDLFGRQAGANGLARSVSEMLQGSDGSRWHTTQEIAWAVTALGKWNADADAKADVGLTVAGKAVPSQRNGKAGVTWAVDRASEVRGLTLTVPTLPEGGLRLVVASEGVPASGAASGGWGLEIQRERLAPDGSPWDRYSFDLGQVIHTRISLTNTSGRKLDNLVLVDRLPAGWEIENPRLGRSGEAGWVDADAQWSPDHMEIRDDRLEVFGSIDAGQTVEVVYAARATVAGRFAEPAVQAEAMYDPAIWTRFGGGRIEVKGPWDALLD